MTAHIFGGIQGMTDAQVRQAYADCRARVAKLEGAVVSLRRSLRDVAPEHPALRDDYDHARAILAKEPT